MRVLARLCSGLVRLLSEDLVPKQARLNMLHPTEPPRADHNSLDQDVFQFTDRIQVRANGVTSLFEKLLILVSKDHVLG